ncbi:MAG: VanZ family protein [Ruminococcaceae bacterium]|nr:VanZ family protein [Oscillospiraceae bacterium]
MLQAAWSYIENAVPFMLIALPIIIGWRIISAWITAKSAGRTIRETLTVWREILVISFAIYIIWLASQTIIPHMEWIDGGFVVSIPENYVAKFNYIPFAAISDAIYKIFVDVNLYYVIFLVGNILVFIPIGFFTGLLTTKELKFGHVTLISFLSSVFIETVQIFLSRMVDIDDVILNTLGGVVGYLLFILLMKSAPKFVEKVKCCS